MTGSSVQQVNSGNLYNWRGIAVNGYGSSANETPSADLAPAERDQVTLSPEGRQASQGPASPQAADVADSERNKFNIQESEQLQKLKNRDQVVRAHELAHLSVAGRYATSGMSFSYQKGPDGVSYAVGGEVGVDMGNESTPEATLQKMETIKRAALAPADPSAADRQIAAQAEAKQAQARQEILRKEREELQKSVSRQSSSGDTSLTADAAKAQKAAAPSAAYALRSAIATYQTMAQVR